MLSRKTNYLWFANLILFIVVVFLGIEQAGRGAEISSLERKLQESVVLKRDLSEKILDGDNLNSDENNFVELGYLKPTKVLYFNSIDTVASSR